MAERVVIARLDVDEQGAVKSVKATEAAVGSLEKQTKTTADVFTHRMFSMREAARALLGGFTLAGVAIEMKNFVTEIAKTDTAFDEFTESVKTANREVQDFFRPFVHEAMVQATDGIKSLSSAFGGFFSTFRSSYESLGAKGKAAFWTLTALLGGKIGAGAAKSMLGLGGDTREADKGDFIGPPGPANYGNKGYFPDPRAVSAIKLDVPPNLAQPIRSFGIALDQALISAQALGDYLSEGESGTGRHGSLPSIFEHFGEITVEDVTGKVTKGLKDMSLEMQLASEAAQTFGDAVASALFTAGTSFKESLGQAMMGLAQTMTAWALVSLAMAAISATGWGAAATGGTPAQFLHAAAAFGIAAAGAYATASALGAHRGGGAPSSAGAGAGGVSSAPGGGGNTYNISVMTEGSSNPEFFGRRAALAIKRALADGAAGGSL